MPYQDVRTNILKEMFENEKSRGKFPIIKLCRILHCVGRRPKGLTELKFKFIITRELGKLINPVVKKF